MSKQIVSPILPSLQIEINRKGRKGKANKMNGWINRHVQTQIKILTHIYSTYIYINRIQPNAGNGSQQQAPGLVSSSDPPRILLQVVGEEGEHRGAQHGADGRKGGRGGAGGGGRRGLGCEGHGGRGGGDKDGAGDLLHLHRDLRCVAERNVGDEEDRRAGLLARWIKG